MISVLGSGFGAEKTVAYEENNSLICFNSSHWEERAWDRERRGEKEKWNE